MERIKIRAWHKKRKEMYYNITVNTYNNTAVYNGESFVIGKDIEVMLWTGLADANGRKIYDNDILIGSGKCIGVKWDNRNSMFNFSILDLENVMKVVGNKYENPELWQN